MTKLAAFLKKSDLTPDEFARRTGVSRSVLSEWVNGLKIPRKENMQRIYELTGGEVTANDFYGIETPKQNTTSLTRASNGVY